MSLVIWSFNWLKPVPASSHSSASDFECSNHISKANQPMHKTPLHFFFYLLKFHYTQMYVIVWMKKSVATAVSSWPLTPKVFSLKISLANVFEFADESYNLVSSVVSCYQGVGGGRAKRYSSQRQRAVPEPAPMHIGVMEGHYYEPSECSTAFGP